MHDKKKRLRSYCRERVSQLTETERERAGAAIANTLLQSREFLESGNLFVYVSTDREPDTRTIIEAALQQGKQVFVPKCLEGREMAACEIRSLSELRPGKMGLLEPKNTEHAVSPERIELAIIPCVGAGRDGTRLGHGGGYYDVFLSRSNLKKICLCFDATLFDSVPSEANDIAMDAVISESGRIYEKRQEVALCQD